MDAVVGFDAGCAASRLGPAQPAWGVRAAAGSGDCGDSQGGGRQGGTAQRCPTRRSPHRRPAQADPTPSAALPARTRDETTPQGGRVRGDARLCPGGLHNPTTDPADRHIETLGNGRPGIDSRLTAPDHKIGVKVVVTTLRDGTRAFGGAPPQGAKGTAHAAPRAALLRERVRAAPSGSEGAGLPDAH